MKRLILIALCTIGLALFLAGCDTQTGPTGDKVPAVKCEPIFRADPVTYDEQGKGTTNGDGADICEFKRGDKTCWLSTVDYYSGLTCWKTEETSGDTDPAPTSEVPE